MEGNDNYYWFTHMENFHFYFDSVFTGEEFAFVQNFEIVRLWTKAITNLTIIVWDVLLITKWNTSSNCTQNVVK